MGATKGDTAYWGFWCIERVNGGARYALWQTA